MKAIVFTNYGPPEVLKLAEVEKPVPGDTEVLVKVLATTVNRTDCGFRKPEYFIVRLVGGLFKPRKKILGSEFAGEVETTGKYVRTFKQGDEVLGLTGIQFGAHAEYLCIPEGATITTKPAGVSFEEAAVSEGFWYARTYLDKVKIRGGDKILINGATGSIGSAGVQLARYYGAEVTAVCNTRNMELVKSLGADEVIDYTKEDFTACGKTFDFIFDAVGKSSFFRCKKLLKPRGIYFSTELGYLSQNVFLPLLTSFTGGKKVIFPIPKHTKKEVVLFSEMLEAGKFKAVIDRRYTLEQVIEAHRYVELGEKTGNVVITV